MICTSVEVVFGIDLPTYDWNADVARAADQSTDIGLKLLTGEGERPRDGSVLYAKASVIELIYGANTPVPVLAVRDIGKGVDVAPWRHALYAFAQQHGLPWAEPQWLVVSNVC